MTNPQTLTGVHHNLSNEEYRAAPGISATLLKGCIRSPKHATTPREPIKAMDTGLRLHEFILERDKFLETYVQEPNPTDYPDALFSSDDLRSAIAELNNQRKPAIKTTGSRDDLLERLTADDPHHFDGVQDTTKLTISDLKRKIEFVNSNPCRGILSTGGTIKQLTERLRNAGYDGVIWPELTERFHTDNEGRTVLPYDEYQKYEDMYQSLITHLTEAAQDDSQPLMKWLLYAFTTPGVLETEVSVFANGSKCRLDGRFYTGQHRIGVELKSTEDASEEAFQRQCARLHYDLQIDHYNKTCAESGEPLDWMIPVVIETKPPYAVNIFIPDEDFLEIGAKKRNYALRLWNEWSSLNSKTAYKPEIKPLTSPEWNKYGPWMED